MPGLSQWVVSTGGEYERPLTVLGHAGDVFFGAEGSYRSSFYSDAADSEYMKIDGYSLLNLRAGFRTAHGAELFAWATNVLDEDYLLFVSAQAGNSGLVIGAPGDPRAAGVTLRIAY